MKILVTFGIRNDSHVKNACRNMHLEKDGHMFRNDFDI